MFLLLGDCTDGGGIRGVAILTTLKAVMMRIKDDLVKSGELAKTDELPLPCDYFDLIGGTSTGGYGYSSYIYYARGIIEFEQPNRIDAGSPPYVGEGSHDCLFLPCW